MKITKQGFVKLLFAFIIGIKMSFSEIKTHKLRSFLSLLGVFLGVVAMVAMFTLLGGLDSFMDDVLGKWVGNVWIWERGDIPENKIHEYSRSPGLKLSDGTYLDKNLKEVKKVYKMIEKWIHVKDIGSRGRKVSLCGVNKDSYDYETENYSVKTGREFEKIDYKKGNAVCIISNRIASRLKVSRNVKKDEYLLGQTLTFNNVKFKIIGIFYPDDEHHRSWRMRRRVFIPVLAMQKFISGFDPNPGFIMLKVEDYKKIDQQVQKIVDALISKHRGVEDFEYSKADMVQDAITMITNISLLMGIIALISLLVGGLGIMNVMLSSISERIREIGIRMALGADRIQIFVQIIAETTVLSFIGGAIGFPVGGLPLLFSNQIQKASGFTPTMTGDHIFFISAIIILLGIIFGIYPALKASRMNPVEALRYE